MCSVWIVLLFICQIPHCLVALQRSVNAVLLGRTQAPDWLTHGIPQLARTTSAVISLVEARRPAGAGNAGTSMASDGHYVYVHDPLCGLLKIGCGYSSTVLVCLLTYLLTYRQVTWHETYVGRTEAVLMETDRQSVSRGIDQLRRGTMARVRVKRSEVKVWVMMRIELGHCCSIHTVLTVWCVDYM